MDRAGRVAINIVTGFVIAVIIASCLVLTITEHQRADRATNRAERAEGRLTATQDELVDTQDQLSYTSGNLDAVSYEVSRVSRTLNATKRERDAFADRNRSCRYLIRVNDQLLLTASAQQRATSQLLRKHPNRAGARRAVRRAGLHVRAVQTIVARSGHRTIGGLIRDCSPTS